VAEDWAGSKNLVTILAKDWAGKEVERMSELVGEFAALQFRFKQEGKFLLQAVVDKKGDVLARAGVPSWDWPNLAKAYPRSPLDPNDKGYSPIVGEALKGVPGFDIWYFEAKMMIVAAAPIRSEADIVGVLLLGVHVSANYAEEDKRTFGVDVAYILDTKVHGTTLGAEETNALTDYIIKEDPSLLRNVLVETRKPSDSTNLELVGTKYRAIFAPFPGISDPNKERKAAYVLLVRADMLSEPLVAVQFRVIVPTVICLGLVLVLGLIFSRGLERPAEEVEKGIIEVVSGNKDYVWPSQNNYMRGIAHQLNNMIASLQGRPLPDEAAEAQAKAVTGEWADPLFIDEEAVRAAMKEVVIDAEAARALAGEAETTYYARLFREFTGARQKLGLPIGSLDEAKFTQKLRNNEAVMKRKYGAALVRFQVVVKGKQVILHPVALTEAGLVVGREA